MRTEGKRPVRKPRMGERGKKKWGGRGKGEKGGEKREKKK